MALTKLATPWADEEVVSLSAFRDAIEGEFHIDLDDAPWKLDDATLLPAAGACLACPKRTGTLPDLFHDIEGQNTCTDRGCHGAKLKAHVARAIGEAQAKGTPLVQITDRYSDKLPAPGKPIPPKWWAEAKRSTPGAVKGIDPTTGVTRYVTTSLPADLDKARAREKGNAPAAPAKGGEQPWERDSRLDKEWEAKERPFRTAFAQAVLATLDDSPADPELVRLALASLIDQEAGAAFLERGADFAVVARLLDLPEWKPDAKAHDGWMAEHIMPHLLETKTLVALLLSDVIDVQGYQRRRDDTVGILRWAAKLAGIELAGFRSQFNAEQKKGAKA